MLSPTGKLDSGLAESEARRLRLEIESRIVRTGRRRQNISDLQTLVHRGRARLIARSALEAAVWNRMLCVRW
jgi:hypothetical protein